jgi:hypothetical protein
MRVTLIQGGQGRIARAFKPRRGCRKRGRTEKAQFRKRGRVSICKVDIGSCIELEFFRKEEVKYSTSTKDKKAIQLICPKVTSRNIE